MEKTILYISKHLFKRKTDNLSILTTDSSKFDEDHIFYQKNCVFTENLDKMLRKQAAQIVANIVGIAQNDVNKETNFLILGNLDYLKSVKEVKSAKMKKPKSSFCLVKICK